MIQKTFFSHIPPWGFKIHLLILMTGMLTVNVLFAQDPAVMENIPLHQRWLFPRINIKTDTSLTASSEEHNKNTGIQLSSGTTEDGWAVNANIKAGNSVKSKQIPSYHNHPLNTNRRGGGIDLHFKNSKITFLGQGSISDQNQMANRKERTQIFLSEDLFEFHHTEGDLHENINATKASATLIYRPDSVRSLHTSYHFSYMDKKWSAIERSHIFLNDLESEEPPMTDPLSDVIHIANTEGRIRDSHIARIDFTRRWKEKNADLQASIITGYMGQSRSIDHPEYLFDLDRDRPDHMYHRSYQLENSPVKYLRPGLAYQKTSKNGPLIEIGFQPDFSWQNGTSESDTLHAPTGNWVNQKDASQGVDFFRALYSGYLNYSGQTTKLHYHISLDIEYMNQMLELTDPGHFNIFDRPGQSAFRIDRAGIFPALQLTYSFRPENHLILSAERNIHRPAADLMFPFLYRRSHTMYHLGNPALQPEYSKNLEASFLTFMGKNKFKLTGFYHDQEDAILPIQTIKDQKWIRSMVNGGKWRAIGANLLARIECGSFSRLTLGGAIYDFSFRGEESGIHDSNQEIQWNVVSKIELFPQHSFRVFMEMHLHSNAKFFQGHSRKTSLYNSSFRYQPKRLPGWRFDVSLLDVFGTAGADFGLWAQPFFSPQKSFHEESISASGPIFELRASYQWVERL